MSYDALLSLVFVIWALTALVLGTTMQRRGYNGFGWAIVGAVLGPLAVFVALLLRLPAQRAVTTRTGRAGPGRVDVLAGVDGSEAALAAALAAAELLEERIRRFTVAIVEPFDASADEHRIAERALDRALTTVNDRLAQVGASAGGSMLRGQPAEALRRHASGDGYELLVIGAHGRGLSKAILGSAAASLLRSSPVPVLVGGAGRSAGTGASDAVGAARR